MKIGLLSRGPELYSTKRIVEAAKERGHEVQVIDPLKCFMNINSVDSEIHYQEKILKLDAVVSRIGASISFYGTAVVRQFEMSGVYALNGSLAITRSRDKLRAHQILSRKKLGMPITGFAHSTTNIDELIAVAGGGDTVAALNHANAAQDFTHISTAGGAFLEWMEGKPLPGVEALKGQ